MPASIDLNCDVGEIPDLIADGTDDRLLAQVTSANIACGGHAGDEGTMAATVRSAMARGCTVGAHPGYEDREQFGRRRLDLSPERIAAMVCEQVLRLDAIAVEAGIRLVHVKPHGALYNAAADARDLAGAIALGVRDAAAARRASGAGGGTGAESGPGEAPLILVGLAGSAGLEVYAKAGFRVAAEGFADRRYEADGRLRARALPGALLDDPDEAAAQAVSIARDGKVTAFDGSRLAVAADTLCIHGDTPGADHIAAAVRKALAAAGVTVAPLPRTPQRQP
jgi:UPF0271 protein